jgi:hypothetical protein
MSMVPDSSRRPPGRSPRAAPSGPLGVRAGPPQFAARDANLGLSGTLKLTGGHGWPSRRRVPPQGATPPLCSRPRRLCRSPWHRLRLAGNPPGGRLARRRPPLEEPENERAGPPRTFCGHDQPSRPRHVVTSGRRVVRRWGGQGLRAKAGEGTAATNAAVPRYSVRTFAAGHRLGRVEGAPLAPAPALPLPLDEHRRRSDESSVRASGKRPTLLRRSSKLVGTHDTAGGPNVPSTHGSIGAARPLGGTGRSAPLKLGSVAPIIRAPAIASHAAPGWPPRPPQGSPESLCISASGAATNFGVSGRPSSPLPERHVSESGRPGRRSSWRSRSRSPVAWPRLRLGGWPGPHRLAADRAAPMGRIDGPPPGGRLAREGPTGSVVRAGPPRNQACIDAGGWSPPMRVEAGRDLSAEGLVAAPCRRKQQRPLYRRWRPWA